MEASKEPLPGVLAAVPTPLLAIREERVIGANAAAAELFAGPGADGATLAERPLAALVAPGDRPLARACLAGDAGPVEVTVPGRGGTRRVRLVRGAAPLDGAVLLAATDLTELDRSDRLLADLGDTLPGLAGGEFLERVLLHLARATGADMAFVGEFVGDPGALVVDTVRACRDGALIDNFRYPLAGTPCETVYDGGCCLYERDVASHFPGDRALVRVGWEGYAGMPLRDATGGYRGILVLLFRAPVEDPAFTLRALQAYAVRVSTEMERTRYLDRLAASERRYRRLVENAGDGLFVQRAGRLLYANEALARMLGYGTAEALLALGDMTLCVAPDQRETVRARARARADGAAVENAYEVDAVRADGSTIRVALTVNRVEWDGGSALQVLVTDVSARAERDERARRARQLESLGKLTGGIAHDFNNLLAVVLGNLELLEDGLSDRDRPLVAQARLGAERAAELTRRLLAFARRQPLTPLAVDLGALLEETRDLIAVSLREGVQLEIEHGADRPVHADPAQLQSSLVNLALNARDAMPLGGTVTLRTRTVEREELAGRFEGPGEPAVCIEVADTGTGMTPDVVERVFEPFFTTKRKGEGTGLGLSMVHGFVRQSRGQIEIDSAPGAGTRVRLYLPVAEAPAAGPAPVSGPADAPARAGSRGRALVIEDEDSVREVAVAMLSGLGFEVLAAGDGPEARARLAEHRFDLVLSDVILPAGERGPAILEAALAQQPDLAVLFMSGYAEDDAFASWRERRDFVLVPKPFRLSTLREHVDAVLGA
ncbi:MAG: ATP-binding protein [Pseudomonadales bacterium]|jgi:PAS domain S-box-containing protein|nr:ATP-binding protein [Pseudomonadales bacterium]